MKLSSLALCAVLALSLMAGCGESHAPIPGVMPQSGPNATQLERGGSWMLPQAKGGDLLYISKLKNVLVYSYPSDKMVGNLSGFAYATGLCSDAAGDVWVTDAQNSQISEYAHGGTTPIAQLSDAREPVGCAVDPLTGNLAVANYENNVSVYPNASGNPITYTASDFYFMEFCEYDASGNLYVDGYRATHLGLAQPALLALPYGSSRLQRFNLEGRRRTRLRSAGSLQWYGKTLVAGFGGAYQNELYQIAERGRVGRITKKVALTAPGGGFIPGDAPFVLYDGDVIGRYDVGTSQISNVAIWRYPQGGTAVKAFTVPGNYFPAGLAMSVATGAGILHQ